MIMDAAQMCTTTTALVPGGFRLARTSEKIAKKERTQISIKATRECGMRVGEGESGLASKKVARLTSAKATKNTSSTTA
jgi:hypothetical protein